MSDFDPYLQNAPAIIGEMKKLPNAARLYFQFETFFGMRLETLSGSMGQLCDQNVATEHAMSHITNRKKYHTLRYVWWRCELLNRGDRPPGGVLSGRAPRNFYRLLEQYKLKLALEQLEALPK